MTPKSRCHRWAPIWALALQGQRLLRDERAAHRETRQLLAVARAQQANSAAELVDAQARIRHLDANITLLVNHRFESLTDWSVDG